MICTCRYIHAVYPIPGITDCCTYAAHTNTDFYLKNVSAGYSILVSCLFTLSFYH